MIKVLSFGAALALFSLLLAGAQGVIGGHFADALRPDPMAIEMEAAFALYNPIWLDSRPEAAFEAGHLAGAYLLNEDEWEAGLDVLMQEWSPGRPVVVYCDGGGCAASRQVALRLREEFQMEAVYWLVDGWDALESAGKVK
ncbi:MAG: hypothetical protein RL648_927 [Verrucomicrobiota bacterium]|jgi:rhodanese-related sulfurtransferase